MLATRLSPVQPLAAADPHEVEALLDRAFGVDRRRRTAYRLREGLAADPRLSYAILVEEKLLAVLTSWPVRLSSVEGDVDLMLVGPVAVDPAAQNGGLGTRLMRRMMADNDAGAALPLVLVGDADYYGRFGFVPGPASRWDLPGPFERHRLLVRSGRPLPATGLLGPRPAGGVEPARTIL